MAKLSQKKLQAINEKFNGFSKELDKLLQKHGLGDFNISQLKFDTEDQKLAKPKCKNGEAILKIDAFGKKYWECP